MASADPKLRITNTLTRTKEDFVPLDPQNVRVYVCGPTVYDFAHIGNARPAIVFDVLYRLLRHLYPGPGTATDGSRVTYVRNITDVDDKINSRAARDYPGLPLNEAIRKVTETTAAQYQRDVTALGCLPPTVQPRATENIKQMITLIQLLLDRGHAYVARGSEGREALFDVTTMPEYGELSKREATAKLAGARVEQKDHKRNPEDFVLWKESDPTEPGWDAEFTISDENGSVLQLSSAAMKIRGRPGWHIECSAMSERYLWDEVEAQLSPEAKLHAHEFDIHAGGLDLIFPHHENEIAQSRCAHGTETMARYWMHNGFLQVEGKKMSKSEGNFVTIAELLETEKFGGRKWPGEVLRLAMLMTHYREPIDFSVARLEEAHKHWLSWKNIVRRRTPEDGQVLGRVVELLADDLNTPLALSQVMAGRGNDADIAATLYFLGLASDEDFAYSRRAREEQREGIHDAVERAAARARDDDARQHGIDPAAVGKSVEDRLAALNAKDFAKADTIRAELLAEGIQLMDGKNAAGERVTTWEVKR